MARFLGRRMGAHERGAEAVEFALVLPVLLLLVFGTIDFGYAINRDTMVNNASREGAREGSLNPKKAAILLKVSQSLAAGGLVGTTPPIVTCRQPPDVANPEGADCANQDFDAEAKSGGTVIVKVSYTHSWITPAGSLIQLVGHASGTVPDDIILSKTTEMRIE